MANGKAFVIISFSEDFENVYDSAIEPAIENNNLIPLKANGEDKVLRKIDDDIIEKIEEAEIIIIDVSKVKDDNDEIIDLSNVYFELGLAIARVKRCIILTQNAKELVFDLKGFGVIEYNPKKHKNLKEELTKKIKKALDEEPIDIFGNIDKKETKEDKEDKKTVNLELLNELYETIYSNNVPFSVVPEIFHLDLRKMYNSKSNFIDINSQFINNEFVEYIKITKKGLNYLANNR